MNEKLDEIKISILGIIEMCEVCEEENQIINPGQLAKDLKEYVLDKLNEI